MNVSSAVACCTSNSDKYLLSSSAFSMAFLMNTFPTGNSFSCFCQDVYRRLAAPQALSGLLRIRTSPEFKATRAHGHLFPDEQYEDLAHVVECEASTTFAFDFEYTRAVGFSEASDNPPMLQAAFQYSTVMPLEQSSLATEEGAVQSRPRSTLWDLKPETKTFFQTCCLCLQSQEPRQIQYEKICKSIARRINKHQPKAYRNLYS